MSDYWKTVAVIQSCYTSGQNNIAYRMVQLYEKKYPSDKGLADKLYEMCDTNLIEICGGL